jgi:ubiquinone/menaquinone biosynthesis C-methylase UbiE
MALPLPDDCLDCVYVQHVLHHVSDLHATLKEIWRCLRPEGTLFLVETVEDSPFIRLGRRLHPRWLGDEVHERFTFAELKEALGEHGFSLVASGQYSVLVWLWETVPDHLPVAEKATPLAVLGEQLLARFWPDKSAHCFVVVRKAS